MDGRKEEGLPIFYHKNTPLSTLLLVPLLNYILGVCRDDCATRADTARHATIAAWRKLASKKNVPRQNCRGTFVFGLDCSLSPAHGWEDADLVSRRQWAFDSPYNTVDEDYFDLIGGKSQVLDQLAHGRTLR